MDLRACAFLLAAVSVLPVAPGMQRRGAQSTPTGPIAHRGLIVNAVTGDPIEADATAFAPNGKHGGSSNCPAFDSQLGQARSDATGAFKLSIAPAQRTFVAVYCQNGYAYRVEDMNANARPTSIRPSPVQLLPLTGATQTAPDVMQRAIRRLLDGAMNDLRYFSKSDSDSFAQSLKDLPGPDREIVELMLKRAAVTSGLAAGK